MKEFCVKLVAERLLLVFCFQNSKFPLDSTRPRSKFGSSFNSFDVIDPFPRSRSSADGDILKTMPFERNTLLSNTVNSD